MMNFTYNPKDIGWTLLVIAVWLFGRGYLKRFIERDMIRQQEKREKRMAEQDRLRREQEEAEGSDIDITDEDDEEEEEEEDWEELKAEEKPILDKKTE
ncbi:hypothetical protein K7432_013294 [Basidiobolus ranarum]|uniref:ATP synthase F0 subunit 8 n=1 Tax=Basidiobolus ranarum TaxID=34480 RepID=A0ABR2VRZ1_9FUNG